MKRVLRDVVAGVVIGAAGAGALTGAAAAQETQTPGQQPQTTQTAPAQAPAAGVVRRILVEGNQRIEPSTITAYMAIRPGDAFDAERIDLSLRTLFATGLFADIQ
ncbi:MAG: POTRA domain-containing protein, partial [Hyphomonadaceae bacterium]